MVWPLRKHCLGVIWRQPAHSPWHLSIATFAQAHDWEDDHCGMQPSYRQLEFASLTGWQGGQDCLITFTRMLGFHGQGLCQRSLYLIPPLHLQDLLHRATTEFHRVNVRVCFFRPSMLGVMTAAHVQDFVKTLAVGHECPLISHQHSCRLVSHAQLTSIHIRTQQLISAARLTIFIRGAPTPDSLEATPTRRDFLCPAIASLTSVRLEPTFVLCATSDLFCH